MSVPMRVVNGGPGAPKKKLTIKPFKTQPKLPDNFADVTWEKLKEAIDAVNTKSAVSISKEELYQAVDDMCLHKMSPQLYQNLKERCNAHIANKLDSITNKAVEPMEFLPLVDHVWEDHCDHMLTIRNIFLKLDRSYVLQTPGLLSIWDMGLKLFRDHLQSRPQVEMKTIMGLLALVECERNGQQINKDVAKRLLRMLLALQTYRERFEEPFLEESARFFSAEGQKLLNELDTSQFLVHVERRLQQAADMVQTYLDSATKRPLIEAIEKNLLQPHAHAILDRGFEQLLNGDKLQDLHRMFTLFCRINAQDSLRDVYGGYIRRHGEDIVSDATRERDMISDLLTFQHRMESALNTAFENDDRIRFALKNSFEHFINLKANKVAEFMAKFVDKQLRAQKGVDDTELEVTLERMLTLFRHLNSKDMFEAFYRKQLSKRLLLGTSSSDELERSMIVKLKSECGSNFTGKLEGMLKDIDLSRDLKEQYARYLADAPTLVTGRREVEADFQVLTTGYWPASQHIEIRLPLEIIPYQDRFKAYYDEKYQGRRLMWSYALHRCIVTARFPRARKELELSLYQTIVLLCFNDADELTQQQLAEQTNLETGELHRTLMSLTVGPPGTRVLTKQSKGKEVLPTDTFSYNASFTSKQFRIKINTIQLKESVEEAEKTQEEVFRDRQYQVDAVIVRIMKARKTLTHNTLINELFTQLKFPARVADLKKRIESLIEREYIERDTADPSVYNYLA